MYDSRALSGGGGAARLEDVPCLQLISVGSRRVERVNSRHLETFLDGFRPRQGCLECRSGHISDHGRLVHDFSCVICVPAMNQSPE